MATQTIMPALQETSEQDILINAGVVTGKKEYYFKAQLRNLDSVSKIWIAIRADTIGKAFVIADSRTLDTRFRIYDGSITEITQSEYYALISRTI